MKNLIKQPDKDFIILNLTDPQLSDQEWVGKDAWVRNALQKTVRELVERVKPNLITVTGDLAWAGNFTAHTMLGAFLDSFGIPWAVVWGNHDQQDGLDYIERVVSAYEKFPNFIYEAGDPAMGNGNYVIGITENGQTVAGIIMMDSHDHSPYWNEQGAESSEWAKLSPEQINWYQQQVEVLRQMGCSQTVLMMHIPIFAYRPAFEAWLSHPDTEKRPVKPGSGASFDGFGYYSPRGCCHEEIGSYPAEDGVFAKILALDSTKIVVVGHDHVNDVIFDQQGVKLVYSLKTGPGCYWRRELNGGTVIAVKGNGTMTVHHEYVDIK